MELEEAKDALDRREYAEAVRLVREAKAGFAIPTGLAPDDEEIRLDLQQVLALAIVRSNGKVTPKRDGGGETASDRAAFGLAWARFVLEYRVASRRNDPRDVVALAEALATDPLMRPRARALLRGLADKDVMPGARGTKLLAELDREAHA